MSEINMKVVIDLKTDKLKVADAMVKKMLGVLSSEELDLIQDTKLTKTFYDIEYTSERFDEKTEGKDI